MKNWIMFAVVLSFASAGNAQLLNRQSNGLRNALLRVQAREEAQFNKKYPSGTNEFGRTFREQRSFDQEERERKAAEEERRTAAERQKEDARILKEEEAELKAKEEREAKYANLKIEGLGGFKFGELEKDFTYSHIANRDGGGVNVELEKPIRHFKSACLSYTGNARRLNHISLIADARGVPDADIEREMEIVKSIVEKKFGIELVKDKNTTVVLKHGNGYLFETSKYEIRLQRSSWYIDTLRLSIIDKKVDDTITNQWDLSAEKDADKF